MTTDNIDNLAWTVDEACQNAWPSPKQILLDGWLLRASGGPTRRTNSVNPLRSGPRDPTTIISLAEDIYRAFGQPAIFRVPSFVQEAEPPLIGRGYISEGRTHTLLADLAGHKSRVGKNVELATTPDDEWRTTWAALNGVSHLTKRIYETVLENIVLPKMFAGCRVDGKLVSIAYGAIHKELLVVQAVATDPAYRQRGYGACTVGSLMDWAKEKRALAGSLQVQVDNTPAGALYRSLGFRRELYQYSYWRNDRG